ncbi:MAG: copper transporter [Actinomycetota bacterium]|nr:copper transporter [Actinomycetota bacterium]
MISFRFHLVSLVAVFLALGVGVLTGTTVLNRGIVRQLQNQTEGLSGDLDELRASVNRLESEAEVWSAFGEETMGPLLSGRLAGRQIVIVTQEGTDGATLTGVRRSLEEAGAEVVALLAVSGRMALEGEADREALGTAVGLDPALDAETLSAEAAALLADRLTNGPNGTDTLELLLDGDFLVVQGARLEETGLRTLGGPDQVVVAVAGGPAPSRLQPAAFLVPLVEDLVARGLMVAAAEPARGEEQEPPFVTVLRGDGEVAARLATQDNVDQVPGQIGLALAVEDLLQGTPGHYGIKDGATRPIPEFA